jgi:membrane dipeptidase
MSSTLKTRFVSAGAVAIGLAALAPFAMQAAQTRGAQPDAAMIARAKAIHERVITLDTHDDISPNNFRPDCNYTMRLTTQVNLPKMVEGGLDVSFMIVYVGQGALTPEGYENAYKQAVAKFDAVHELTEKIAPKQIGLALTPADVVAIAKSGRKVAVIGIENGYSIGTDLERVKEFWTRGGRYMSLAHNGHSQLADSNTGEANNQWMHNGLSELGKKVIAEMNRWGIMVDVSHPAKTSNMQAIALSKAPVIASHSAARALADHSRNLDDEQLEAIKKNGGVVQTVAFASYVKVEDPKIADARQQAVAAVNQEFGVAAEAVVEVVAEAVAVVAVAAGRLALHRPATSKIRMRRRLVAAAAVVVVAAAGAVVADAASIRMRSRRSLPNGAPSTTSGLRPCRRSTRRWRAPTWPTSSTISTTS